MGKVLIINYDICNGCYNCQLACKDEHVANDWSPIAKPQPDTGQFWNKVHDNVRGQVPKVKVTYEHSICQHCDDAPCIPACNAKAIYKRDDGAVIIDPDKCRGNKMCIVACPYENIIYFNDALNIAQKCTFCAHLLDKGWKEPRCVDACPTGAFTFGEETDPKIKLLMRKAQPLKADLKVKPRVHYIGLPKKFIAGAVYDSQKNECVGEAIVTLTNIQSQEKFTTRTDSYGDFWFKDLKEDIYKLLIEKKGYQSHMMGPIDIRDKDVNIGNVVVFSRD
jgi:tetrathionate reductase subunit B